MINLLIILISIVLNLQNCISDFCSTDAWRHMSKLDKTGRNLSRSYQRLCSYRALFTGKSTGKVMMIAMVSRDKKVKVFLSRRGSGLRWPLYGWPIHPLSLFILPWFVTGAILLLDWHRKCSSLRTAMSWFELTLFHIIDSLLPLNYG